MPGAGTSAPPPTVGQCCPRRESTSILNDEVDDTLSGDERDGIYPEVRASSPRPRREQLQYHGREMVEPGRSPLIVLPKRLTLMPRLGSARQKRSLAALMRNDEPERDSMESPRPSVDDRVTSLRGPATVRIDRRLWLYLGFLGLLVLAVVLVVSFLSTTNDNARIDRMKAHGLTVAVTVIDCIGNIGGSGSTSAGYTCHGDYTVGDTRYHELIGSMSTFSPPGTVVRGIVDPSRHSTVVLASAIRTSVASPRAYVPSGLLTIALISLTLVLMRAARRHESSRRVPSTAAPHQGH